jgi:vesicle-associated membrane protein 7
MAAPSTSGGAGASDAILYALVARGAVVLAEHSTVSGNSSVVAVGLLQKVPLQEGFRASWAAGQHIFHILSAGGLTYLCMAGQVGG